MFADPSLRCLLILCLVSNFSYAILNEVPASGGNVSTPAPEKEQSGSSVRTGSKITDLEANATFYYDADAFLTNKTPAPASNKENGSIEKVRDVAGHLMPASSAMTSARNGRMLDLDALMGDFAASQANKERIQTGNRQSRYLSSPTLDVGAGKKLHIQGFIPIVGVKDVTGEDGDQDNNSENNQDQAMRQRLKAQSTASELPYAQSSMGHASFGIQRYLNSELQPVSSSQQQIQQTDAKFSGATVVETLKRPIRKLTGYAESDSQIQQQNNQLHQQQQNCLCVPFYMCKNGYISESSLGKSQIQQMLAQQQQASLDSQLQQSIEMKSGQLMLAPQKSPGTSPQQQQQPQIQPQYADSYVPVDERSLDREIITMAPLTNAESSNQSDFSSSNESLQQQQPPNDFSSDASQVKNSTDGSQSSDYSQEILGRMLGLKLSPSRSSTSSSAGPSSPSSGVCGLLRSCCNIPANLFPSQQDMANEHLMSQYGNTAVKSMNKYNQLPQPAVTPNKQLMYQGNQNDLAASQNQQVMSTQRYQNQYLHQLQQQQFNKLPYGFPSQASRVQPLNTFNPMTENSLAHRSNQFQGTARYQAHPSIAQYTRAAPQMQQLQSFQQSLQQLQPYQQQLPKSIPSATSLSQTQQLANMPAIALTSTRNPPLNGLGTRKILEGRCGIRQSAGITGRVQNLQYHESSADFGEYPAQAAILKRLSGSDSLFVCGGTLISQYWIATAAHCIKKHALSDLKIRLGEWDVHRDDEFYPYVEKEVRDLVVHPEFVAGNLVNDIALLRLDSPVDPSLPHVNPACLPNLDESFARQRCWVTGWGKDSFGQKGSFQAVLREVELPVIGQAECESALRQTRLGVHYRLHSGFICAGGEGGKDACEGDGGSGLYCVQDGTIKVAGLVSWGIGCGQAGVPGVYVNLAHYRPWIENIISIDEDIYSPYANMIANSLISERSNANTSSTTAPPTTTTTTPISIISTQS